MKFKLVKRSCRGELKWTIPLEIDANRMVELFGWPPTNEVRLARDLFIEAEDELYYEPQI